MAFYPQRNMKGIIYMNLTFKSINKITAVLCFVFSIFITALGVQDVVYIPLVLFISVSLLSASLVLLPIYYAAVSAVGIFSLVYLLSTSVYMALAFALIIVSASVAFALIYKEKRSLNSIVAGMTVSAAICAGIVGCIYIYFTTGSLNYEGLKAALVPIKNSVSNIFDLYLNIEKTMQTVSSERYEMITEAFSNIKMTLENYMLSHIIGLVVVYILALCFFSTLLAKAILKGMDYDTSFIGTIGRIRISKSAGVLYVLSYIGTMTAPGPVGLTFSNLVVILSAMFTCSGISAIYYFLSYRKPVWRRAINMALLIIINFIPLGCGMFLTITGVMDTFFNYRKFPSNKGKVI